MNYVIFQNANNLTIFVLIQSDSFYALTNEKKRILLSFLLFQLFTIFDYTENVKLFKKR